MLPERPQCSHATPTPFLIAIASDKILNEMHTTYHPPLDDMSGCYCSPHYSSAFMLAFPLSLLELVQKPSIKHPCFLSASIPEHTIIFISQILKIQTLIKVSVSSFSNNFFWNCPTGGKYSPSLNEVITPTFWLLSCSGRMSVWTVVTLSTNKWFPDEGIQNMPLKNMQVDYFELKKKTFKKEGKKSGASSL